LGPPVREPSPTRTRFCSAPLLVCFVCRFLLCHKMARVVTLIMMIGGVLKASACFRLQREDVVQPVMDCHARKCHIVARYCQIRLSQPCPY